jgi:hypothetical protein
MASPSPTEAPIAAPAAADATASPPAPYGEPPRIRFVGVGVNRLSSGRCRATVTLQRIDGEVVHGSADVEASAAGDLRGPAAATVEALHRATHSGHRFTLLGVKSVRAFDRQVVLVQIGFVAGDRPGHAPVALVGAAFADADLMRATVLAVLNATNRVLWTPQGAPRGAAPEAPGAA